MALFQLIILSLLIWTSTSNRLLLIQTTSSGANVNVVTSTGSGWSPNPDDAYCLNGVGDCTAASDYATSVGEIAKCINGNCAIGCDNGGDTTCNTLSSLTQMSFKCDNNLKVCATTNIPGSTSSTSSTTTTTTKSVSVNNPAITSTSITTTKSAVVSSINNNNCATTTLSCTSNLECETLVNCFDSSTIESLAESNEIPKCIEGECTITCKGGDFICSMGENAVNNLFPDEIDKLVCEIYGNGNIKACMRAPTTTTTTTSSMYATLEPVKVTSTTYSTTKPDMSCKTASECETKASHFGWGAINQEHYICIHNMCTVTCNNYNLCPNLQTVMNTEYSTNYVVKCENDSTGTQKICAVSTSTAITSTHSPINPPMSTFTSTKPTTTDLLCQIADDCKAKASDFGFGNTNPTDFGQHYACVNHMCTITCTNDDICNIAQSLINTQLNTHYILECKDDPNHSAKVCTPKTTTTKSPIIIMSTDHMRSTTDDGSTTCDTDPCSPTRLECEEKGPDEYCSVQFDFDIDVCILNHAFRRSKIYKHIRGACEYLVINFGAICENGEIVVLEYDCEKKENPQYLFDAIPTTNDQCPVEIDEKCVDNTGNGFAANIQGAVALFCKCENEKDLVSIEENLSKSLTATHDFVEQMKELSITDDTLCHKGFGKVEANKFIISIRDGDGNIVETFDITANNAQRYYYFSSFVILIMLFLL